MSSIEIRKLEEITEGDHEAVCTLARVMLSDAARRIETMDRACYRGEWKTVAYEAHTLKSAALCIGAIDLANLCAQIDDLIRLQSGIASPEQIEAVKTEFNSVKLELDKIIEESPV